MKIRNADVNDAEKLLEIYGYYVTDTAITFEYDIPSVQEFQNRIRNITAEYPYIVCEDDSGEIIGYAYAGVFNSRAAYSHCAEVTIYVKNGLQHHGTGKFLYEHLEEMLKRQGIINLYACIGYPHHNDEYLTTNSADYHRHMGYNICGTFHNCGYKFGRWYDMIFMEKIIGEYV